MSRLFESEEIVLQKPFLLLSGITNPLIFLLSEKYEEDFAQIIISDKPIPQTSAYTIANDKVQLLTRIKEKIDYAVFYLEHEKEKEIILTLLPKLTKDNVRTVVLISLSQITLFFDLITKLKTYKNITVAIVGDVYGKNIPASYSHVARLVEAGLDRKVVTIHNIELKHIHPIYEKDAINFIQHGIFGEYKKNRFFLLYYKEPQTYISAIHIMKRVEPDLEIKIDNLNETNTSSKNNTEDIPTKLKNAGIPIPQHAYTASTSFEESLFDYQKKETLFSPSKFSVGFIKKFSNLKKGQLHPFPFIASFLLFFVFFQILLCVLLFMTSKNIIAHAEAGNAKAVKDLLPSAQYLYASVLPTASIAINIPPFNTERNIRYFTLYPQALSIAQSAVTSFDTISKFPMHSDSIASDVSYLNFAQEKLLFDTNGKSFLLQSFNLSKFISVANALPLTINSDKTTSYLILFQNNAELRPTGGFIGSVGELTLEKGSIKDFKIRDVYELDGQLKAHVEPYYIVRRYLQPHMYLRDSNFLADFAESATYSALLYNLETKKKVDGVVAVDFEIIKEILKITGPITLFDYNKTLDDTTILDFLQSTIQTNFFPGSTQKKDLLNSVWEQIHTKIQSNPSLQFKIALKFLELAEQKHILFYSTDESLQPIFTANSLSGSLTDLRTKKPNGIYDFLSINEANIGVNKANQFVTRKVDYLTSISSKELTSTVKIDYANKGDKTLPYTAYIRIFTPLKSKLKSIAIDGKKQKITTAITNPKVYEDKKFKLPEDLEVYEATESNRHVIGFVTKIIKDTDQTIEISYTNGAVPPNSLAFNYNLLYVKQPGTQPLPFTLHVGYGSDYSVQATSLWQQEADQASSTATITSDKTFELELTKKQ